MTTELCIQQNRSVLRIERRLAHRPEKVWRALTEPAHLNQWFPFNIELDLKPQGKITFIEPDSQEPSSDGLITECDPPHLFAFRWGEDLLQWEVQSTADGCLLIFTQTFDDHAGAASFASGWQVCLDTLDLVLAGKPLDPTAHTGPAWKRRMDELHESYIDQLDLRQGQAELMADGWQVRFERQLTKPIDTVWTLLVGNASSPVVGDAPPLAFTLADFPAAAITTVTSPHLLEYAWHTDHQMRGRIRWELTQGTGHGTRLILTQTGPSELAEARFTALTAWQTQIEQFAKRLLDSPALA